MKSFFNGLLSALKSGAKATEQQQRELAITRLQAAVDGTQGAIIMVNRDLVVTYTNESTKALLKKHEVALESVFPGFSANKN